MKFNINHTVKVKLTQHGRDVLRDNHRKLFARSVALHPYSEPAVDAEGWTEFQLWELMAQLARICITAVRWLSRQRSRYRAS